MTVHRGGAVTAVARCESHAFSKPTGDEIVLVPGLGVEGDAHAGVTVRHRSRVAADPTQPNLRQVHLIHGELFEEVAAAGFAVTPGQLGENITTAGLDLLGLPRGAVLRFGRPGGDAAAAATKEAPAAGAAAAEAATEGIATEGVTTEGVAVVAGVGAVVEAAGRAKLDGPTAGAVAALIAAARRDAAGVDDRPAVVVTGLRNPCRQIDGFRGGLLRLVAHRDAGGRLVRRAGVMGVVLRGGPVRPGDPVTVELPPPPHVPLDRV
jgi:MOSC domain-containing protein YiiM